MIPFVPEDEDPLWQAAALCRKFDPETWFDESLAEEALEICSRCPSRLPCLNDALLGERGARGASLRFGIRGGLTPTQRAHLAGDTT